MQALFLERLKGWARDVKRDVVAVWLAARDPRTPLGPKLLCALVAAYALSPIDLIPDFVPILGYVDDLILVPAGLWLALRLLPPELLQEHRETALRTGRPVSRAAAVAVIAVWIVAGVALSLLLVSAPRPR